MSPRGIVLARRRERLVQRSGLLRRRVDRELRAMQPALTWMDRIQEGLSWLRSNPLLALTGSAAFAASRPRRLVGWGLRAWSAWKLWQQLRDNGRAPPTRPR